MLNIAEVYLRQLHFFVIANELWIAWMSPYMVNRMFLSSAYHPAVFPSLSILSSPPCILIISCCPPMSLTSSLFLSNILLFSSYIISSPCVSPSTFYSSPFLSCRQPLPSLLFLAHHLFSSRLISSSYLRSSYLLPPSPLTLRWRLKYEETIKLRLISIWTGGWQATAGTTTEPWKSTAELFLIPGMTFYRILLNETEQSSASPFRQSNYHQNKRAWE